MRRHVNGLKLRHRTLVDRLGFASENIRVLNYDGSLRAYGDCDPNFTWPGDRSPFRTAVSGPGSRAAFQQALSDVRAKLTPTARSVHQHAGARRPSWRQRAGRICSFIPVGERYRRDEFCADLALLPEHRSLVGFSWLNASPAGSFRAVDGREPRAGQTYMATATTEKLQSFVNFHDGATGTRSSATGSAPRIAGHTVHEAFQYGRPAPDIANPYDSTPIRPLASTAPPPRLTLIAN